MREFLTTLSWAVFLVYGVTLWHYISFFKNKTAAKATLSRRWVIISVAVHSLYLAVLTTRLGHIPVSDTFTLLTACAWFFVVVYLIIELRLKEVTMGVFFLPIILLLQVVSNLFINFDKTLSPVLLELFFEVHVAFMISAYAAFTISCIASIMYILLAREMQSKKLGIFFERLPSLQFIDNLSNHAVNIGLLLVMFGFALGYYMGLGVWEGTWAFDPKMIAVAVSLLIYIVHFVTRRSFGWQGHRAAIVSVVGFSWLLFSFIIVTTFFSKIHNFQ